MSCPNKTIKPSKEERLPTQTVQPVVGQSAVQQWQYNSIEPSATVPRAGGNSHTPFYTLPKPNTSAETRRSLPPKTVDGLRWARVTTRPADDAGTDRREQLLVRARRIPQEERRRRSARHVLMCVRACARAGVRCVACNLRLCVHACGRAPCTTSRNCGLHRRTGTNRLVIPLMWPSAAHALPLAPRALCTGGV